MKQERSSHDGVLKPLEGYAPKSAHVNLGGLDDAHRLYYVDFGAVSMFPWLALSKVSTTLLR